jgi:hypothetical protein
MPDAGSTIGNATGDSIMGNGSWDGLPSNATLASDRPDASNDGYFKKAYDNLAKYIKNGLPEDCLKALKITNDEFVAILALKFYDGRKSTATIGSIDGFSVKPDGGRAFDSYVNEQQIVISKYFSTHRYVGAVYAAGDNSIWLGFGFFNGLSLYGPEAVLGHELMHAITKSDDDALAKRLNITLRSSTDKLSEWFSKKCLTQKP